MSTSLSSLSVGQIGEIICLKTQDNYCKRKLLAMGVIPGAALKVTRVAPMGDPIEISIKKYNLSLRRDEAKAVIVKEIKNEKKN